MTDKILVIKHGAFGDLIQADGSLRAIREHYSSSHITLLTAPTYQNLMSRCPHIDAVITDSRAPLWHISKTWSLCQKVNAQNFSLVIDLQNSDRTRSYRQLLFRHLHWIARKSGPQPESGLSGQVSILNSAGISCSQTMHPDVGWMAENVDELLASYQINEPYIVLIPGSSSSHKNKRWPYFTELATTLLQRGYQVVCLTGPDENELAQQIPGHHLRAREQYLSWFQIAGLLRQSAFVIGNDTGPSHVASCLGCNGFAVFGPTSAARAEIARKSFSAIQVKELSELTLQTVLAEMQRKWPDTIPPPAKSALPPNY